ncbi:unnamed protein product [Orchesella dallaii]|uniref:MYND-type domain-containing protein n=1 Tax=Orchesella dallaii TaxID=48710 RepID=A0ABP1RCY2_9HEXA
MALFSPEQYFYKVDNMLLSSCQLIRKLFQARWKELTGNEWEHTEEQGKLFIEGIGKPIYKKAQKLQKGMLSKGCLDEWDLPTISMVLQNFGNSEEYAAENETVRKLIKIRNDLAHHSSKQLSEDEYTKKVDSFRENLRALQVNDEVIEKMIEKAGITSSVEALEATKILYEKGDEHMSNEEFTKALEYFNEATTTPSLLPVHQGVAHEKRAECYLKLAHLSKENQHQDESNNYCDQAMNDAKEAFELNDNSWKAHYLLAQCYRWQKDFDLALQHYSKALALSPVQKQVKQETDSCKALAGFCNTKQEYTSMELTERLSYFAIESGRHETEEYLISEKERLQDVDINGKEDVFRGKQYAMGWSTSITQNDEEAARYFAKADKVGNPEGTYHLGLRYANGKGIPQDLPKSFMLFLKAAKMSPDFPGSNTTTAGKNVGVASTQYCIALMYENGIKPVVEHDLPEAAMWYLKAIENGIGNGATNLAKMYEKGYGVPKNEKQAEIYWKRGVELKDPNAAEALVGYYIKHIEPELARKAFENGKTLGSGGLKGITDEEIDSVIEKCGGLKREKLESEVVAYENANKFDAKEMTFLERLQRYEFTEDQKYQGIIKELQGILSKECWGGEISSMEEGTLEQLARVAYQGSQAAEEVLRALKTNVELTILLEKEISEEEMIHALNLIYECLTLQLDTSTGLWFTDEDDKTKLKRLVGQLFERFEGKKSDNDMKSRFCYAFFNQKVHGKKKSQDTYMFDLLKQGIGRYPDNVYFYHSLSYLYSLVEDQKSAIVYVEKGLQKFPDNADLLYYQANQRLQMLPDLDVNDLKNFESFSSGFAAFKPVADDITEVIKVFKKFVKQASYHHRRLPEVYYSLAYLQLLELKSLCPVEPGSSLDERKLSMLRKLEFYNNLGNEAEEKMLPCYLPCVESKYKKYVKKVVENPEIFKEKSKPPVKPQQVNNTGILERKQYLSNSSRQKSILQHRQRLSLLRSMTSPDHDVVLGLSRNPKLTQKHPKRMGPVKSITLKDVNITSDQIFEDKMIDLTIIEEPVFESNFVHILAEDENGEVIRLDIYNFKSTKVNEGKLDFGRRIAILNPYIVVESQDGILKQIRNDEPKCIIYLGKVQTHTCRFCGEDKTSVKCSICRKALYCSTECRALDRKLSGHDLVCFV